MYKSTKLRSSLSVAIPINYTACISQLLWS